MSFDRRFETLLNFDDDIDTTECEQCKYANGDCFNAGYCIKEQQEGE
jgi:hypothetical protein